MRTQLASAVILPFSDLASDVRKGAKRPRPLYPLRCCMVSRIAPAPRAPNIPSSQPFVRTSARICRVRCRGTGEGALLDRGRSPERDASDAGRAALRVGPADRRGAAAAPAGRLLGVVRCDRRVVPKGRVRRHLGTLYPCPHDRCRPGGGRRGQPDPQPEGAAAIKGLIKRLRAYPAETPEPVAAMPAAVVPMPVEAAPAPAPVAPPPLPIGRSPVAAAPPRQRRCLLVDDSRVIRKVAHRIIAELGYEVIEAENGEEALARCRVAMPDLILLDWEMPVMSGVEFVAALRGIDGGVTPKVVFCTSKGETDNICQGIGAGADEYVTKPFDQHTLLAKLQRIGAA